MTSERKTAVPNVIIFGETGAGKSSVVNMLAGGVQAPVSSRAEGVTFQNDLYEKVIQGSRFNIFDTVGLNEGVKGTVSAPKAIEGLYRLMRGLDGGINLLMHVVRGRLKSSIRKNYDMFYKVFCETQVPIVLVITGLENEEDMDAWWDKNKGAFGNQGMSFAGAACITAITGKNNCFAKEFEESKEKVRKLISGHCSQTPWIPPGIAASRLTTILVKSCNRFSKIFPFKPIVIVESVYRALKTFGEMGDIDARNEANRIYEDSLQVRTLKTVTSVRNVIIFGETGVGKSSVVNMLDGGVQAPVSSAGKGVTFQNRRYEKVIQGSRFDIFDIVGLNERVEGTMSAPKAIEGLYRLMRGLDGGINLLVYVVRGPHFKSSYRKNYEMFYEIFCEKQVPIVLAITGLEDKGDMNAWWYENEGAFMDKGMSFADAACITATRGKRNLFAKKIEESKEKVEELIFYHCSKTPWLPPAGKKVPWLVDVLVTACNRFPTSLPFKPIDIAKSVHKVSKSDV